MATLILSDGTRSIDFLSASGFKVPQDGINLPVVSREDTFAEGSDSEGRSRVRSRATNSTAGQISLYLSGATASALWTTIDNLQELVESAHLNKGSISYLGPGASSTVTYDLESISLTDLPQVGIELTQLRCNATITFESKPYGRLATQRLNVQDSYQAMVTALSPSIFLPLGASSGLTDLSGNARNGTAAGGVTVGGATGPLTVSDGGATDFDGTDDRITTTYATRQNLVTNPRAGASATTGWSTAAGVVNAGATITAVNDWRDTAFNVSTTGAAVEQGAYIPFNLTSGTSVQARIRLKRTAGTGTIYARVVRNSSPWTTHVIVAASTQTEFSELTLDFTPNFTGEWVLIVGVNEASATTFRFTECLVGTAGTYFDGAGFENPEGLYQASIGQSGWRGTAHASISDLGCFANGTTRTFMGWANRDVGGASHTLVGGSNNGINGIILRINATSGVDFFPNDGSGPSNWAAAWPGSNQWVHWALVFDEPAASNNVELYINGVSKGALTQSAQWPASSSLEIGSWAASQFFDGKQAWVSVHQSALTATQIRDAYDTGKARITLDGPIDFFTVENVPGQVPALPVIELLDRSSYSRGIVEVGVQNEFDPGAAENLRLDLAAGLTAQGGSSNTRAGSVATNIIRAVLATTPISICKAASQTHKGLWKVRARVYPSATTVLVRLAWRAGDGPFAKEKWVTVPSSAGWFDLDLGTVNIKELPSGHTCEFRIEAKSTSGSPTVDVDIVECLPADSYTKLRGSSAPEVGSGAIVAMDDFSTQTAGAVTGKTPLLAPSGTYGGAGDADDFQVVTSSQHISRSAVSDSASNNGRYLRCGTGVLILATVECDWFRPDTGVSGETFRQGIFLRYTDTSNWLFAGYLSYGSMAVIKRVAGTETVLALAAGDFRATRKIRCSVDASGNVIVQEGHATSALEVVMTVLADSSLATAGALATGGYGIYDAETLSAASIRDYDNFTVSTLATSASIINPAINSGYGVDLKHNTALTDNATGTSTGTTPIRQGNYPKLPPATRNGSKSRVVVRARRDDNDLGLADTGTADVLAASLSVTPRVHLTGT